MKIKSGIYLFIKDNFPVIIFCLAYAFLELVNVTSPGLFDNEAFPACGSLQIMKGIWILPSLQISGIYFPIMLCPYESAIESYILLPFLHIFGINTIGIRMATISVGMLTLIFTYLFAREFFNKKTAIIACLLTLINSSFLLETKLGFETASMIQFTAMATLYYLWRWFKENKRKYFYMAVFLLGLGISIRVWFIWQVTGLMLLAVIFSKKIKPLIKPVFRKYCLIGTLLFSIGILPFIVYNITSEFHSVKYICSNIKQNKEGISNLSYIDNLKKRLTYLDSTLSGKHSLFQQGSWNNSVKINQILSNPGGPLIFIFSLCWLLLSLLRNPGNNSLPKKRVLFILLLFIFIMLQTPFTLSKLSGPHLLLLIPLIQIITAAAITDFFQVIWQRKKILFISMLLFTYFIIQECTVTLWNNYVFYEKTGGTGNYSDRIGCLTDYLEKNNILQPVLMDWGLRHNLIFLSGTRLNPVSYTFVESGQEKELFIKRLEETMNTDSKYIFHSPEFTNRQEVYHLFEDLAKKMKKQIKQEKIFYQQDGNPVYIIYSVS